MEHSPTLESEDRTLKERAINAYKQFVDKGITNPDDLDLDDVEVKKANQLYYDWQKEIKLQAGEDEEKQARADIDITMFNIDAGFTDPEYLDEVLNDHLFVNTSSDSPKDEDNLERNITRQKIAQAMKKIRGILASQKSNQTV